jgi:YspA, cpYpsA-related SLOG family
MRLLVCGGRNYADRETFANEIAKVLNWVVTGDSDTWLPPKGTHIISGGASGADAMAIDWAVVHWTEFSEFKAEWGVYGRRAGPIRNQRMLDEGKPDKVLAFPGGAGTADMVRRARAANIPVTEVIL